MLLTKVSGRSFWVARSGLVYYLQRNSKWRIILRRFQFEYEARLSVMNFSSALEKIIFV